MLVKDEYEFLEQVKRCIVELIYFVKEEVRFYANQEQNLHESELQRYRKLVLLIHHLNMFILQEDVFPAHYNPDINYDPEAFSKKEQYSNKQAFFKLATQINDIIARFEN